ncbi:Aste57867_14241 [Aphanomyces stellatus]|uniref:Aste57867_14241 protein n=1 Tax=Aphanomyces stellatus TaxID=120398 RepID=A0A485L054_9STRA|nr:hypothetical protein As57867_014190 [Aphanomyces stellatus]VFT91066.1 Aste57867_14241 [Aphanomyces stellatus]
MNFQRPRRNFWVNPTTILCHFQFPHAVDNMQLSDLSASVYFFSNSDDESHCHRYDSNWFMRSTCRRVPLPAPNNASDATSQHIVPSEEGCERLCDSNVDDDVPPDAQQYVGFLTPAQSQQNVLHTDDGDDCSNTHDLWSAARQGDAQGVQRLLQTNAKQANEASPNDGAWPLHLACVANHPHIAYLLLAAGANVHARNNHGDTPLHVACQRGDVHLVHLLLDHGADPTAKNHVFLTPVDDVMARTDDAAECIRQCFRHQGISAHESIDGDDNDHREDDHDNQSEHPANTNKKNSLRRVSRFLQQYFTRTST